MYGCNPSTEEGGISLARFSALLVPDIAQFIFIGQAGKAEALPTCVPGQKKKKKNSPPRLTPAPGIPWSTQLSMQPSEKAFRFLQCVSCLYKAFFWSNKMIYIIIYPKQICSHQNVSPHRFYLTIMILLWCSIPKGKDHLQIKTFNFKTVQCWVLTPILSSTGPNVRFCPTSEVISALILKKNVKIWTKL